MDLVVSVDELKSHLRLEGIETDDDLLCRYIKAAEGYCNAFNEVESNYTKENAPEGVKLAIMMLASSYFMNREATTERVENQTMFGVHALLRNHRKNFSV